MVNTEGWARSSQGTYALRRDSSADQAGGIPLFDLTSTPEVVRRELRRAFERVLASGSFVAGEEVAQFERAFARRVGVRRATGVGSGTAALFLALRALEIGPGDEVILPANTFFATLEAVAATGATPVLADVRLETASIDPASVADLVTPRSAAVIPVHLYGIAADVDALRSIVSDTAGKIVEDAAQGLGATWLGRPVGSLGDAAAFSFYATKNLGALGEAGAVTTDNPDLADRVGLLRSHGEIEKNTHVEMGFNERLDELQAAFLRVKLRHLADAQASRRAAALTYAELLADVDGVTPITAPPECEPSHHLCVVRVGDRDRVVQALRAQGVGAGIHYPTPLHRQPVCQHLAVRDGQLARAEELAATVLSLPLYPGLTQTQIERCVTTLAEAVKST